MDERGLISKVFGDVLLNDSPLDVKSLHLSCSREYNSDRCVIRAWSHYPTLDSEGNLSDKTPFLMELNMKYSDSFNLLDCFEKRGRRQSGGYVITDYLVELNSSVDKIESK